MYDLNYVTRIARVCHEANRAYCKGLGDDSHLSWDEAPQWQRDSAIQGVIWQLDNPIAEYSAQHDNWMKHKLADGWVYGGVKDAEKKTHPCLVEWEELPYEEQLKDVLFSDIVTALR